MRQSWTDGRLDDLNQRVDGLNQRVDDLSRRMDAGFARVDARFDAMQRTMVHGVIGMSAAMTAGFAALIGVIATQL